jgi:sugar lactone lactonase YvrE
VFVPKLAPSGAVVWSRYLGDGCEDVVNDIAVDPAGYVYVTGRTGDGCFFGEPSGVIVAKFDPDGHRVYVSLFGGRLADSSVGHAIAVDAQGQAYVAGTTHSATHDFPTTAGAYRRQECANDLPFANVHSSPSSVLTAVPSCIPP